MQVEPDRLKVTVAIEHELLAQQAQTLAAHAALDVCPVEIGNLWPGFLSRHAENLGVARAGKFGIAMIVEQDASWPDQHGHGHGRGHHGAHRTLEAFWPIRNRPERIGRPVKFVDQLEDRILLEQSPSLGECVGEKRPGHSLLVGHRQIGRDRRQVAPHAEALNEHLGIWFRLL
jgi:hypothetical protein